MKKSTRMLLMNNSREKEHHKDMDYSDYGRSDHYRDGGYREMEDRFRDRRGREHYDDGRYAPMRGAYDDTEMRRGGTRRRDSRGRFTNEYDYGDEIESEYYPMPPYAPPVYERYNERSMPRNKVGFSIEGEMEPLDDDKMERMGGKQYGTEDRKFWTDNKMSRHSDNAPIDRETAMEWTESMKNEDGTTGPHWTMEQAKKVLAQKGLDCDPIDFYVALNATYSDLCKVFKKHNINTIDAYTDFAIAFWLKDQDAVPNKLAAYYDYIVKH